MVDKKYFPALTGLRAIAAYMVFCHHYRPVNPLKHKAIYDFVSELHVGVTIFFVLSGFLLTYRYFDFAKIDVKQYFVNRFARIYPMYFLLTTITFIGYAIFWKQNSISDLKIYLLNITFLRGFFQDLKFSGVAQGWSLTVEEVFYFLTPLLLFFIKKDKWVLLFFPFIFLFFGFSIVLLSQKLALNDFMQTNDFMLDFTFFGRCTEFFLGMGLAILIKNKIKYFNFRYFTYVGILFIILSVYFLSILKVDSGFGTDCVTGKIINTLFLPIFGILPLLIGLIKEKTFVSKILESNLFLKLGKSSYVFYLIHIGIFALLLSKISENVLFLFLALNILSFALYRYLEEPLNKWFRKFS